MTWSDVARIPIDPVTSTVDHFIPGLAVDPTTSGSTAHLALTYYFYPNAACGGACSLDAGFISSPDGGAHWGPATQLAGPLALSEIAMTSQGPMVGDDSSTEFSSARAQTLLASGASNRPRRRSTRRCARQRRRSLWQRQRGATQPSTAGRTHAGHRRGLKGYAASAE